jgi:signal transduction histidine kinase
MWAEMIRTPEASAYCSHTSAKAPIPTGYTNDNVDRAGPGRWSRKKRELAILFNAVSTIGSSLNLEEVLWSLYKESGRLINAANFALAIYDDRTDTLLFPLVFDQGERVKPFSVRLSSDQGLVSRVLTSQIPLLIRDLPETGIRVETDPICPAQPIRSWLSVPVRNPALTGGKAQGVIVVWSDQPDAFTNRQMRLLSALAAQAAIAIRNARLFQENARLQASVLAERERVIAAEEQVREALACDLHDGPIQLVSGIKMRLDFCQKALERDPSLLPEQITHMQELAEHAVHQMRTMLFELRPLALETGGLEAALRVFLERQQEEIETTRLTLNVETCQPNPEISRLEPKVEAVIFAIVQEAVNNALKHAQASRIEVHLKETPTAIHASILDDGVGFEADKVMRSYEQQGSLGLVNIRERAELIGGELTLESLPDQGTRIAVCVPKAEVERLIARGQALP